MAAVATYSAMPTGMACPQNGTVHRRRPFDAGVLARKLEEHQRTQENEWAVLPPTSRDAGRRASYVPRMAAQHFSVTTTPRIDSFQRPKSTGCQFQPDFIVDGAQCVNPGQLYSAFTTEIGNREAVVYSIDSPKRHSTASNSTTASYKPKRFSMSRTPSSDDQHPHAMRSYKPGDAARRRVSQLHQSIPESHAVSSQRASCASFDRECIIDFHDQLATFNTERRMSAHDSPMGDDGDCMSPTTSPRGSRLATYDRPDWSQRSQCGDDADDDLDRLPQQNTALRRRIKASRDHDEARRALEGDTVADVHTLKRVRQKSKSDQLGHDAAKHSKMEERVNRRQSIVDFFKRR